jgi:hypothetical protein
VRQFHFSGGLGRRFFFARAMGMSDLKGDTSPCVLIRSGTTRTPRRPRLPRAGSGTLIAIAIECIEPMCSH